MFRDGDDSSKVGHLMQSAMLFTPAPTSFAPVLPPGPQPRNPPRRTGGRHEARAAGALCGGAARLGE